MFSDVVKFHESYLIIA